MSEPSATDPEPAPSRILPAGGFTAREAAMRLGVHERTIRRAIARGDLPAEKRGRAFVIAPGALDRFRASQGKQPEPAVGRSAAPTPIGRPPLSVVYPAAASPPQRLAALPSSLTRLIGRDAETEAIVRRLCREDVRLVTLTGPAGVGKTRLALQVASRTADDLGDEVLFVALADVTHPAQVLSTIARTLGVRESPGIPPPAAIAVALRGRSLLLVLDNLEHLAGPSIASDLAALLAAIPGVKVLATSRVPLRLSGEHRIVVPPLALPAKDATPESDDLAGYGAVALFVERARQVRPDFTLDAENAGVVTEICRRLDGLPLALELAAAWLRALSPEALLQRLQRRLPLLVGGGADLPARQRTMGAAIAWSHDLLTPDQARLFRRLAVFAGGFDLDGAEGVTSRLDGSSSAVLGLLASLIDASLVQPVDIHAPESRFTFLETVREFALERLAMSGEEAAARDAHAAQCFALAEAAAHAAERIGSGDWLRRLNADRANLRAALDWFEQTGNVEAALRMTGALWHYWYRLGEFSEGRNRLERAIAAAPQESDPIAMARALRGAGVLAWQSADYDASRDRLKSALDLYLAQGDQAGAAWVLNSLGCLAATLSDAEQAEEAFARALAIFERIDDPVGITQLTANLGELAQRAGDHEVAIERLESALARWHALEDRVGAARAQVNLAHALLARTAVARTWAVLRDALVTIRDHAYEQILPLALRAAAQLAVRQGDPLSAVRWYGAEERARERLGVSTPAVRREGDTRALIAAEEALSPAAFALAWEAGLELSAAQAIDEVLSVLAASAGNDSPVDNGLSPRERAVLRLLATGHSDRQIAEALFITRRTASKHVSAILSKLGVASRTAAVAAAHRGHLT